MNALNTVDTRYVMLGLLRDMAVVLDYTERQDDSIRIISMRKATKHEEKLYFQSFGD